MPAWPSSTSRPPKPAWRGWRRRAARPEPQRQQRTSDGGAARIIPGGTAFSLYIARSADADDDRGLQIIVSDDPRIESGVLERGKRGLGLARAGLYQQVPAPGQPARGPGGDPALDSQTVDA